MRRLRQHGWLDYILGPIFWLWRVATYPFVFVADWIYSTWWNLSAGWERSGWSRWWRIGVWYALMPVIEFARFVAWFWQTMLRWPQFARFEYLLQGLPALLVATAVLLVAVVPSSTREISRYEQAAAEAFDEEDYEAARVYYKALTQLDDSRSDQFRYRLAETAERLGEHEQALALMASLAPPQTRGYAAAHYWQARELLSAPAGPEELKVAEDHLLRTLQDSSQAIGAHVLLGQLYHSIGRFQEAESHFLQAAQYEPASWLPLARIHAVQGKYSEARAAAERAWTHFRRLEESDLDNHDARINCAESLMLLQRFSEAAALLNKGIVISPDPRYRESLSRVYFFWSEALRRVRNSSPRDRQALLRRAFQASPTNRLLLQRLVVSLKGDEAEVLATRDTLNVLVADDPSSSVVQFLLAVDAMAQSQPNKARQHLNRAKQLDSEVVGLISELARAFAEGPVPLYDEALWLVNLAQIAWPGDPHLRHTRGFVLARQQKPMEALVELDAALVHLSGDRRLHWILSEVYGALGMPHEAAEHRDKARASIKLQ